MAKYTKAEIAEAKADLAELLNPRNVRIGTDGASYDLDGQTTGLCDKYSVREVLPTVYFVIDSVSRSGMSRTMRVYVSTSEGELRYITAYAAKVLGWSLKRGGHDAVRVDGCGMDMTFHLLDCVLHAVFGYGQGVLNANHYRREIL